MLLADFVESFASNGRGSVPTRFGTLPHVLINVFYNSTSFSRFDERAPVFIYLLLFLLPIPLSFSFLPDIALLHHLLLE